MTDLIINTDSSWQWRSLHGQLLTLRPITLDDRPRFAAFVAGLSYGTRYFRYGQGNPQITEEDFDRACRIDPAEGRRFVVVMPVDGADIMVGTGGYFKETDGTSCIITIVVTDAWQGTQIAHRLMTTMIQSAVADGLQRMVAEVMATNQKMLRFIRRHGFTVVPGTENSGIKLLQKPLTAISL